MKPLTPRYEVADPKSNHIIELLSGGWVVKEVLRDGLLLLAFEPPASRCLGESRRLRFELKEEHLKLLAKWNLEILKYDNGFTSLQSDDKRPFGNSSYIEKDIAAILGVACESEEDACKLLQLLAELPTAAQVVLQTTGFQLGHYERYSSLYPWQWSKVQPARERP